MHVRQLVERLVAGPAARVAVVGDMMLDVTTLGEVSRISPEAPVPVVSIVDETATAGGAANAAVCVAAFGASVALIGKTGTDGNGATLRDLLEAASVGYRGPVADEPTITKHRIRASGQQLLRLDTERIHFGGVGDDVIDEALLLGSIDAVLVSDYGKGVVTREVMLASIGHASAASLSLSTRRTPTSDGTQGAT
jgi:rfaE bifunctional protein kinase chain/domain